MGSPFRIEQGLPCRPLHQCYQEMHEKRQSLSAKHKLQFFTVQSGRQSTTLAVIFSLQAIAEVQPILKIRRILKGKLPRE